MVVVRGELTEELLRGIGAATIEEVVDTVEVELLVGREDGGTFEIAIMIPPEISSGVAELEGEAALGSTVSIWVEGEAALSSRVSDCWLALLTGSPFPVIRLGAAPDVGVDPEEPMKAMTLPSGN